MSNVVTTAEELASRIKKGDPMIEVTFDIHNQIIKILSIGPVAWLVVLAAVGVAVVYSYKTIEEIKSGQTSVFSSTQYPNSRRFATIERIAIPAAALGVTTVATGGLAVAKTAAVIALAAGSVGVLSMLRNDYDLIETDGRYFLRKKQ